MQLRLLTLFLITSGVGLFLGIATPFVRQWGEQRQLGLVWLVSGVLVEFTLIEVLLLVLHQRAHRWAGRCIVSLPHDYYRRCSIVTAIFSGSTVLMCIALMRSQSVLWVLVHNCSMDLTIIMMMTLLFSLAVFNSWGGNAGLIELCEFGIVVNGLIRRQWPSGSDIRWDELTGRITFPLGGGQRISTIVAYDARKSISSILGVAGSQESETKDRRES